MIYIPNYFTTSEMECKCGCGKGRNWEEYDPTLLHVLDRVRGIIGRPLLVTSGMRCEAHDKAVGGTGKEHVTGQAADVACDASLARAEILRACYLMVVHRLGIAGNFIHIGVSVELPHPRVWLYPTR